MFDEDDERTLIPPMIKLNLVAGQDDGWSTTTTTTTIGFDPDNVTLIAPITSFVHKAVQNITRVVNHAPPAPIDAEDEKILIPLSEVVNITTTTTTAETLASSALGLTSNTTGFESMVTPTPNEFNYATAWVGVSTLAILMVGMLVFLVLLDRRMRRLRSSLVDLEAGNGDAPQPNGGLSTPTATVTKETPEKDAPRAVEILHDDESTSSDETGKEGSSKKMRFSPNSTPSPTSKRRHDPEADAQDQIELKHLD